MTTVPAHILLFEPRSAGHHLPWLRLIADAALRANPDIRITIGRPYGDTAARDFFALRHQDLWERCEVIDVTTQAGKWIGGSKMAAIAQCLKQSGAEEAFVCNFDEIASSLQRRAALGLRPPHSLKGRISGIYIRPRPLDEGHGFNHWLKARGMRKLASEGWFNRLYVLDEFLAARLPATWPQLRVAALPDPWDGTFNITRETARERLGIDPQQHVTLFYGIGDRRKGLHLMTEAMAMQPQPQTLLLCAGRLREDAPHEQLAALETQGRAKVINRFITDAEEKDCFAACDLVALPYISHYGSSSMLSRAAAAGKPVLASGFHLLGKRVRDQRLGWTFADNNAAALHAELLHAVAEQKTQTVDFSANLRAFAAVHTEAAFYAAFAALPFRVTPSL